MNDLLIFTVLEGFEVQFKIFESSIFSAFSWIGKIIHFFLINFLSSFQERPAVPVTHRSF